MTDSQKVTWTAFDVFYEETRGLIQKSDMGAMVLFCQINREDKGSRRVTCAVRNVPVMFTMTPGIGGSLKNLIPILWCCFLPNQ